MYTVDGLSLWLPLLLVSMLVRVAWQSASGRFEDSSEGEVGTEVLNAHFCNVRRVEGMVEETEAGAGRVGCERHRHGIER